MQRVLLRYGLFAFVIVLLLTLSSMFFVAKTQSHSGALSPEEAMKLIASQGKKLTIIDVRTRSEFEQGHIPEAQLLPVQTLEQNIDHIPDDPILLVCRSGQRAKNAYNIILKAYPQKKNLWYLQGSPLYHPDGTYQFISTQSF